jgi:geranylgeranyl diphosphate synthase type II
MIKSLNELRDIFESYLEAEKFKGEPQELYAPNNYILGLGGKRLRPILVLLACELLGQSAQKALAAALAIEYFHNYTLMHDDIMDKALLRRGQGTVHAVYGLNEAILSGDVMMIYAYRCLNSYSEPLNRTLIDVMNQTAIEVCEGQSMDLSFEKRADVSEAEYLEMIRLKTSVLLAASLKTGALIGGAKPDEASRIYEYGENLGLAFQMQDDLLDTYGGDQVGKKIGGDIIQNKKTLLLIRALQVAEDHQRGNLLNWLKIEDADPEEKIAQVKELYRDLGVEDYVVAKRDGYVEAALRALTDIKQPHEPLEELVELLVRRNF